MQLMVLSIPQQFQVLYSNVAKTSSDVDVAIYDRLLGQFATENHFDWISTLDAFMSQALTLTICFTDLTAPYSRR